MLYGEKQSITFRYQVNVGGELNVAVAPSERDVEIVFEDGTICAVQVQFWSTLHALALACSARHRRQDRGD